MEQILIVEDDSFLNKMLDYNLTADGYGVTSALNARTAAEAIRQREFDLVLLDINLPDGNGFELCKLIKPQHPDTIVIFLTANDQESDQIRGYEVGAVDYITKPFVIGALQRKIKAMFAMLEHHKPAKDIYDDGRLFLDFSEQTASLHDALPILHQDCLRHGLSMDGRRGKMKVQNLSVKRLFGRVAIGLVLSMSGITIVLFFVTKQTAVLLTGGALLLCALVGIFVLTQAFGKRLSQFTANLCQTLDHMIAGNEAPQRPEDSETQLARIGHRLARLYQIMQENRRRVDEERQELQTLVSDISHQVKTPVSNLKMATDTLLEKPMTEAERTDFIRGIRSQTDKLDFLFQALVKTSRLETGVIQLDKKPGRLFDTVAQAMSGIVYAAEKKEIVVSVDCPEDLTVFHDSKWTSEALFNLLDNAVKYTPAGGKIAVSVVLWEMYVEIKVTDTGKGISESNQAAIFRRFYREEEVHEQQGVGIGLYLAREIVMRQGGYVKVVSEPGKGSEFSIMLPTK